VGRDREKGKRKIKCGRMERKEKERGSGERWSERRKREKGESERKQEEIERKEKDIKLIHDI
jgi:hypothetical protein